MASIVDILPACEEDFSTLASIVPRAMGVDLLDRIMFENSDPFDTTLQEQFVMAELRRAESNPRAHIIKATIKGKGEIVGYGLVRFHDGKDESSGPSMASFPPGTNARFVRRLAQGFGERHRKHMGGKPHASES